MAAPEAWALVLVLGPGLHLVEDQLGLQEVGALRGVLAHLVLAQLVVLKVEALVHLVLAQPDLGSLPIP